MAVAFLLGAAMGIALGPRALALQPLGDLLIRLLKMLVLPIVVSTILVGLSSISAAKLSRIGVGLLFWYTATASMAAALGVAVAHVIRPGIGLRLPAGQAEAARRYSPGDLLSWIVPENLFGSVAEGQLLPAIFFSILFALALDSVRRSTWDGAARSAEALRQLFELCARSMYTILHWVMQYAPIGTLALISIAFSQYKLSAVAHFARVISAVYLAQALACALCLALLMAFRMEPFGFVRKARDALMTAFVTGSSAATLPVEMEVARHELKIDRSIFSFALPLGVSVHKIGTAAHLGVVAIFAANMAGSNLSPGREAAIALLAFLGSVATPPISGGAFIILGLVLQQAGLPLAAIGLVAGIPFLGKFNTPINSLGRLVSTALAAKALREEEIYSSAQQAAP